MCDFTAKTHRGQVANLRANLQTRSLAACENWFIAHGACGNPQPCAISFVRPISLRTISFYLFSSAKRSANGVRSQACRVSFNSRSVKLSMKHDRHKTPDSKPFSFLEFPKQRMNKRAALM